MKLNSIAISLSLLLGATATPTISLAASASEAVASMTVRQKHRDLLRNARKELDMTTKTGSIKSESEYDARGIVTPNAEVTLGAGVAAKIMKLPFKDGEGFKKGDELVVFDCARQRADLRGANAGLEKAGSFYHGKKRMKARGAAGSQEVRDAASDVASARANVEALGEVLNFCKINAPFDGRVVERHAETHEIPAANAPVLTVVDDSALELDLIVPSRWLRWVKKGSDFKFEVDELGQTFNARVSRLGAKVDAVSQTIKITGMFVSRPGSVLAGMSGTAKFDTK